MKSKFVPLILCLSLLLSACGTSAPEKSAETPVSPSPAASPTPEPIDPRHLTTADELEKITGIFLPLPDGASDAVYSYIQFSYEEPTAELQFTLDGIPSWIRAEPFDPSRTFDSYLSYTDRIPAELGSTEAMVCLMDGTGYIAWADSASSLLYRFGIAEGADAEKLKALAEPVYYRISGEPHYPAYQELIDLISKSYAEGTIREDAETFGISEVFKSADQFSLGWIQTDINGDGVLELLFGANTEDGRPGPIYDIYTSLNGDLIHSASGRVFNKWFVLPTGQLVNETSSDGFDCWRAVYGFFNGKLIQTVQPVDVSEYLFYSFNSFES